MRRYRARRAEEAAGRELSPADYRSRRKPGPRPKPQQATIPAHPGADRGYAADFLSPIRHVATELENAGIRGCTVEELTAGYQHPNPGDLSRVRLWHGVPSDREARRFLVDRALSALWGQVKPARRGGAYRLAVPFDDLRFEGRPVHRTSD
jgi:hypothetical protein